MLTHSTSYVVHLPSADVAHMVSGERWERGLLGGTTWGRPGLAPESHDPCAEAVTTLYSISKGDAILMLSSTKLVSPLDMFGGELPYANANIGTLLILMRTDKLWRRNIGPCCQHLPFIGKPANNEPVLILTIAVTSLSSSPSSCSLDSQENNTPLHIAAKLGNNEVAKALLAAGADASAYNAVSPSLSVWA